jgi:hypothetical protein
MTALPQVIAEISRVAGPDAAWALVRAWGGRHVYIPPKAPDGHWLVKLVGRRAADSICEYYRDNTSDGHLGRRILIPMATMAHRGEAWSQVLSDPSLSIRETAGLMGVSERAVSYRRAKSERGSTDDRQGKLPL